MNTPPALTVAARMLHEFSIAHQRVQAGDDPAKAERFKSWEDLPERGKESALWLAGKAATSETFAEFYAWTTLAQRQVGWDAPEADSDTERTRGARAQYFLVQSLAKAGETA